MRAEEVRLMDRSERMIMSHKIQTHFGGKMGVRTKVRGGYVVVMRGHSGGVGRPARSGYECGQTHPVGTRHVDGRFKVEMPRKLIRYVRPVTS